MKITMDMGSYEIERDSIETEYNDHILYAGWNPEVASVSRQLQLAPVTDHRNTKMPDPFMAWICSFRD